VEGAGVEGDHDHDDDVLIEEDEEDGGSDDFDALDGKWRLSRHQNIPFDGPTPRPLSPLKAR